MKMLRMYDRRADDTRLRNYLEVCQRFSNSEVGEAVKNLIAQHENIPNPRALAKELYTAAGSKKRERSCDVCGGVGFVEGNEYDVHGLKDFLHPAVSRCALGCKMKEPRSDMLTQLECLRNGKIHVLAGMIAKRAVDGQAIKSTRDWARYLWTRELYDQLGEVVDGLSLVNITTTNMAILSSDIGECQSDPLGAALDLARRVKMMPAPKIFESIT